MSTATSTSLTHEEQRMATTTETAPNVDPTEADTGLPNLVRRDSVKHVECDKLGDLQVWRYAHGTLEVQENLTERSRTSVRAYGPTDDAPSVLVRGREATLILTVEQAEHLRRELTEALR